MTSRIEVSSDPTTYSMRNETFLKERHVGADICMLYYTRIQV